MGPMTDMQERIKRETLARGKEDPSIDGSKPPETMVRGFMTFPTTPPPEDVLAGDAWMRVGDLAFLNSGAGAGKSVIMTQASISWGLGLSYLGIAPSRPLRILHFVGEDDESTLGQCREGLLEHAEELFGHSLSKDKLEALDLMVRTDFHRQATGKAFLDRMDKALTAEPADVVIINPLLSYIGGEVVASASEFLRDGLMPLMQKHRAAAFVAHHTTKLNRASWDEMDFTYSGIGGGEVANAPRTILTLAPTKAKGLHALHVSKRQTTGWKDDDGRFTDRVFFRRSDCPTRPAWLPVSHSDAEAMMEGATPDKARTKKVGAADVVEAVRSGAMQRQALMAQLKRDKKCGDSAAKEAIDEARELKVVTTFDEKNPRGGKPVLWVCLPEQKAQWSK